jgi:cystathionine beta-lyase
MNIHTTLIAHHPALPDVPAPTATPLHLSSTFHQPRATEFGSYDYSRTANPTRDALESLLATLEGAHRALAYPSGMAALAALSTLLKPGDEVLASRDVYGGTFRLFCESWKSMGIVVNFADLRDAQAARSHLTPRTRLIHAEALGNPLLTTCDVAALAELAHSRGALLSIDNTSLTPLNLRPLDLGADLVVHSATKYLCGHSDVTAGVLAVKDPSLAKSLAFHHNAQGSALPPFDCYMLLRGLQTLAIRLERQQRSALEVATALAGMPGVLRVRYPGLAGQPGADVHRRQSRGDGAVISFETGDPARSRVIVESLRLFAIRVSFGAVSSSVSMPCFMSHASIPEALRATFAPPQDLVRLSIGLEDPQDLVQDLRAAIQLANQRVNQESPR